MSYGYGRYIRRVPRRGRRTYNRTSRLGYSARKALRGSLPLRKRLLRSKTSGRPIKRRRIQTRPVLPPRIGSPFKCQKEVISSKFFTNGTGSTNSQSTPDVDRQIFSLLLSPKAGFAHSYRKVEDAKARYVGCNIMGTINFDQTFLGAESGKFVIRVVQSKVTDTFGGTNVNFANDATYMSQFWKDQTHDQPDNAYLSYENPRWQLRNHFAMNMDKFKVLKTKYITLNQLQRNKTMGFHFFIPMRAQLEKDRTMTALQWDTNRSTASTVSVERYAYYKPIILIIEPVLHQTDTYPGTNFSWAALDLSVKHTFKDG